MSHLSSLVEAHNFTPVGQSVAMFCRLGWCWTHTTSFTFFSTDDVGSEWCAKVVVKSSYRDNYNLAMLSMGLFKYIWYMVLKIYLAYNLSLWYVPREILRSPPVPCRCQVRSSACAKRSDGMKSRHLQRKCGHYRCGMRSEKVRKNDVNDV